jgi:hypothetical protein
MTFDQFKWELGCMIGADPFTVFPIHQLMEMHERVGSIHEYEKARALIHYMITTG